MNKNKVIVVGIDASPLQVVRMCQKKYAVDFTKHKGCTGIYIINHNQIINNRDKIYSQLERVILSDEDVAIFHFESMSDVKLFDEDGILRECAYMIEEIDEYTNGYDVDELYIEINKLKLNKKGNSKVILVDTKTNQKYLIGSLEPVRKIYTDKDVEFGIYPFS